MRFTIAAAGKLKSVERDLVQRYAERFDGTGRRIAFGPLKIIEIPESRADNADARKRDEALRLMRAVEGAEELVALHEAGAQMTSTAFARSLARHRDEGKQHVAFLIGGPDGHDPSLLDKAPWRLSLGAMTLPHGLARLILVEQLYRAATILTGHPYHRV